MTKKVLIVAENFPPNGVTSSRRPGEMAKYLPNFGWTPIVITSKWRPDNCNYDPSIVPNIQEDLVKYETESSKPHAFQKLTEQVIRVLQPQRHPYSRLKSTQKKIEYVLKNEKIDAIWVTVPPFNLLEATSIIASKKKIPWIADFRDAWQFAPNQFVRLTMASRLKYERELLMSAAAITTVSTGFAETLQKRHNRLIQTIPHGFDPELNLNTSNEYPEIFNIVFTGGAVLGKPNFRPLLDAIGKLIQDGKIIEEKIRIDFFGAGNSVALARMFENHKYANLVKDYGPIPRIKAIENQRKAAILLAAGHPGAKGVITSKIFEYITAGRPILSIPKDNDCIDELLEKTNCGVSCTTTEEIKIAVLELYKKWESGELSNIPSSEQVLLYSSHARAKELANLLNEVTGLGK
ncbi:glycosyltransferase [Malikia spinosa]|uniref:glycosyltransferase n=1 Tax=Malikia spinosa TaxID=86180 RepID=UPI002FDA91EB